ncbi:MAG: hypothetical protein CMG55_07330 [Candidatus Marinimicrobia bacterium]|nr:hypothetical protein [Candidatus Neomarinimicrobiota bacterium]|tara:strand:+ start:153 stop:902 length:750 start_codon:yes stop_codon:yes gene_type:complete
MFSCASNPWERLNMAQSIAVVSINHGMKLEPYSMDDKGNPYRDDEAGKQQVGLSEMAALGKGFLQKGGLKKGFEAAKDAVGDRAKRGQNTMANLKAHADKIHGLTLQAVSGAGYDSRQWDDVEDWFDLKKMGKKTKKLCQKTNANIVMAVDGHIGVVKETKKMKGLGGLINLDIGATTGAADYTLIARYNMFVADEEGYIGKRHFRINSGITKQSDKGLPEFTAEDFQVIYNKLSKKMKSLLKESKMMG